MSKMHVEEESLEALKTAISDAGESYKTNLAKLTNLIGEITSGDIQGDLAVELETKFEAKRETLNRLASTIDEAAEYMGIKTTKFTDMISNTSSGMK